MRSLIMARVPHVPEFVNICSIYVCLINAVMELVNRSFLFLHHDTVEHNTACDSTWTSVPTLGALDDGVTQ